MTSQSKKINLGSVIYLAFRIRNISTINYLMPIVSFVFLSYRSYSGNDARWGSIKVGKSVRALKSSRQRGGRIEVGGAMKLGMRGISPGRGGLYRRLSVCVYSHYAQMHRGVGSKVGTRVILAGEILIYRVSRIECRAKCRRGAAGKTRHRDVPTRERRNTSESSEHCTSRTSNEPEKHNGGAGSP